MNFQGKEVAILGLSTEGQDSVKFFAQEKAKIFCCDRRTPAELGLIYQELARYPVEFQLGPSYLENLSKFDLVIRTAGMSLRLPELIQLQSQGNTLTSLTKLFFSLCPCQIIGVTGTKGKGTTSTLIAEILKANGNHVYLGGNVGAPLLSQVRQMKPTDIVVLELSSFQLEDLTQSPKLAVVLRTTQEHLANYDKLATNYHETREAYVAAKKSIVRYQKKSDYAVLNLDDPTSASFGGETPAQKFYFSLKSPQAEAYVANNTVYLRWQKKTEVVCSLNEIKLRGIHNLENIAAAAISSRLMGANHRAINQAVRDFVGLPHRLELVRVVKGLSYYDDSFSTVPETTIAAVKSFSEPLVIILGGSEKGSDFTRMGQVIATHSVKAAIVIGQMTTRIVASLRAAKFRGKIIIGNKNMTEIIRSTLTLAQSGDVVLLSPACASFDLFKNYKERGDLFKNEVNKL